MGSLRPEPVTDPSHAVWIGERLARSHGLLRVGDLVPSGFERYGRLLHPVRHREEGAVRWARVANWSGRALHPTVLFDDLARRADGAQWENVGGARPEVGELSRSLVAHLAGIAADFTSTPEESWYCVWFGYGGLEQLEDLAIPINPADLASARQCLLYKVPVGQAANLEVRATTGPSFGVLWWKDPGSLEGGIRNDWGEVHWLFHSPMYWWPDDHAWFLSTDIDAQSTYIGGSADLIERLKADPELEVLPATLEDPFDGVHPGMRTFE